MAATVLPQYEYLHVGNLRMLMLCDLLCQRDLIFLLQSACHNIHFVSVNNSEPFPWGREAYKTRTQDQEPNKKNPESWALCCTVAIKIQLYRQSVPILQAQTHDYMYVITMHTKSVIYTVYIHVGRTQCCFELFSDLFDSQRSLLSVFQSHTCTHKARGSQDYLHVTFHPTTFVCLASHTSSHACNKGGYSWGEER